MPTILLLAELPGFLTILKSYSVLAFQFDIHPVLLTLQIDMKRKTQVSWAALSGIASKYIESSGFLSPLPPALMLV